MFGHIISLNFNKKGESHTTFIGGFFSMWIKIIFTVYCYMKFQQLFNLGDNNLVTTILWLDLEAQGKVDINKTNYHSYSVFKKQTVLGGACPLDKTFYKNLNVYY